MRYSPDGRLDEVTKLDDPEAKKSILQLLGCRLRDGVLADQENSASQWVSRKVNMKVNNASAALVIS